MKQYCALKGSSTTFCTLKCMYRYWEYYCICRGKKSSVDESRHTSLFCKIVSGRLKKLVAPCLKAVVLHFISSYRKKYHS